MAGIISTIKYLLLTALVVGLVVVGYNAAKNKPLYPRQTILKEDVDLIDKIKSVPPEDASSQRVGLLNQVDDFVKGTVSGSGFSPSIYSLIKVRLDQALKEVSETQVPNGKVKVWYLYNMGVIAKSSEKTIAIDLAGTFVYPSMPDFTKYIDVLFITHFHNDHFDKDVVQEALRNGVTIVIPDEKVRLEANQLYKDDKGENIIDYLNRNSGIKIPNLIAIKPLEKTVIKGVEVIGYPAIHDGSDFAPYPLDWYYVNLSGFKILHTGDGTSFDYQTDFETKNVDLFITHNTDPKTNEGLIKLVPNAKVIFPLHVWELGHGPGIVDYMNYKNVLYDYSNGYYKGLEGKTRFIPMIWGESILF